MICHSNHAAAEHHQANYPLPQEGAPFLFMRSNIR